MKGESLEQASAGQQNRISFAVKIFKKNIEIEICLELEQSQRDLIAFAVITKIAFYLLTSKLIISAVKDVEE